MTTIIDDNQAAVLRARIITHTPNMNPIQHGKEWWLLGTTGCHLCTQAEQLLDRFQAVYPMTYHYIDIADFDDSLMMAFATSIPVLLTPSQRLDYPFSVMDLQRLL